MIRVTYPNEGLYEDGQPRWEQVDKGGQITFCRFATPEEAAAYALVDAVDNLRCSVEALDSRMRDLATYGIPVSK